MLSALVAILLGIAGPQASPPPPLRAPRLAGTRTFALAIGSGGLSGNVVRRLRGYRLVVVDGQQAAPAQVQGLQRSGHLVFGYLSVGTIEPGRPWFGRASAYRLERWPDFNEYYADTSAPGYRSLILGDVAPAMLAKGFDGLFLDNVDMTESHPAQRAGMQLLIAALGSLAHGQGKLMMSQNGEASIGPLLPYIDAWNREDVASTYSFATRRYLPTSVGATRAAQAALRRVRSAGVLVTATGYARPRDPKAGRSVVTAACAAGAIPFVSNIGLTRVPQPPPRCR